MLSLPVLFYLHPSPSFLYTFAGFKKVESHIHFLVGEHAVTMATTSNLLEKRLAIFQNEVTIYPVSCEKLGRNRTDLEWLAAVLAGGARIVQLRDKEASGLVLYEKALEFRRQTKAAGALLIINDRPDIALAVDADGVHLGNDDIPAQAVRQIAPDLLIGVSCNTEEQAATAAQRGASYFNIGPLFATKTKKDAVKCIGANAISVFARRSSLPFTVMGGIKLKHVPELVALGAQRIAVVTALTEAQDIAQETRRWHEAIVKNRSSLPSLHR